MQLGQAIRRFNDQMKAMGAAFRHGLSRLVPHVRAWPRGTLTRVALMVPLALVLYYGLGALWMHKIDDDPDFEIDAREILEGESASVALAGGLIDREINRHGWVANDPFYLPTSLLWNMAAYQGGIVMAAVRFTEALGQALGARNIGSADLDAAAVRLSRPGDVWVWDFSEPLGFLGRSENQYREGYLDLNSFNVAVADGTQAFPRDAGLLLAIVDGLTQCLGDAARLLTDEAAGGLLLFDTDVGDAFYKAKGAAYAEFILMKGLEADFGAVIRARGAESEFEAVRAALLKAARLSPAFVANGRPDGAWLPAHPYVAGYFLLQAKDALDMLALKLR